MRMNTALLLAAGRGERLRPLTDNLPKALCRIHNVPLIEYHLRNLAQAGYQRVVINHAHLGDTIRRQLGNGSRFGIAICYAPEPPGALETRGGIVNALPLLGKSPFITINADIFTDFPFEKANLPEQSLAHLVLVPTPSYREHGDFGLSQSLHLDNTDRNYTFSGIACYDPKVFYASNPGRYSVTPLLRQLANNHQATGELYLGSWFDIGTPERLLEANQRFVPPEGVVSLDAGSEDAGTGCAACTCASCP